MATYTLDQAMNQWDSLYQQEVELSQQAQQKREQRLQVEKAIADGLTDDLRPRVSFNWPDESRVFIAEDSRLKESRVHSEVDGSTPIETDSTKAESEPPKGRAKK